MSTGIGALVLWHCNTVHFHSMKLTSAQYLTLGSLENVIQYSIYGSGRGDTVADFE